MQGHRGGGRAMLKFLKSRSKVMVKVTRSKFMVPLESSYSSIYSVKQCHMYDYFILKQN